MKDSIKLICLVMLIFHSVPVYPQVQRIDHFVLNSPGSAFLIERFVSDFGLPVTWQSGENAGISLGNVVMECSNYASSEYNLGIGLEPVQNATDFITLLNSAGVAHGETDPHYMKGEDGSEFLAYTLIDLHGMLPDPEVYFFVVDYASRDYMRKLQIGAAEELAATDGGLLGVEKLDQIIVGTENHLEFQKRMNKLPGVKMGEGGLYNFKEGPSILLTDADGEDFFELVIKVRSLQNAAERLNAAEIPIEQSANNIQITDKLASNVIIRLIE